MVISNSLEQQTWAILPVDLLELIFSRLIIVDNIRASAVCKLWHLVATSVRVVNQTSYLMNFQKINNCYEIYDPVQHKTHSFEFPELDKCRVCYTKDGWLLLYSQSESHPFSLFSPFTRELIKLPRFATTLHITFAAFSCAPTSTECVIFAVQHVTTSIVAISTCYPEATEWTTNNYHNGSLISCGLCTKIVFSKGLFYCLSNTGWLYIFDPIFQYYLDINWKVPPPKCLERSSAKSCREGKFLTEHEGNIFLIYVHLSEDPIIFKLDKLEWKEVRTLDGATFFLSFLSSHSKTYITGVMRNSVYFPKLQSYEKHCVLYSLDDHCYYPGKQCRDLMEPVAYENMWIESPKDFAGWM